MAISRRRHLQGLAALSIGALASACGNDSATADRAASAAAPQSPPPQPANAGASPFNIHFVGLHVFGLMGKTAVASMPKASVAQAHTPYLITLGGRVESSVGELVETAEGPLGLNAYGVRLAGYAVAAEGSGDSLVISDDPIHASTCGPATAAEWASMQHVVDIKKVFPQAAPNDEWNKSLAAATVSMNRGTLKAMPGGTGFKTPAKWRTKGGQVKHRQFMTGAAAWTFDAPGAVRLTLTPLPGAEGSPASGTVTITRDQTGPVFCVVAYVPLGPRASAESHVHLSYKLFKGIPAETAAEYVYPELEEKLPEQCESDRKKSFPVARSEQTKAMLVKTLLQILNDGTIQCPPTSFRS